MGVLNNCSFPADIVKERRKRYDFSNGAWIVAIITMDYIEYVFSTGDRERIEDFLRLRVGKRVREGSGVPVYEEAALWCSKAAIGDTFEDDDFDIFIDNLFPA